MSLIFKLNKNKNTKIASFDLDDTLIKTKSGKKFPIDYTDWQWCSIAIPIKLAEIAKIYNLVVFSNQKGIKKGKLTINDLKEKSHQIVKSLGVPIDFFFAIDDDQYRKPKTGMFNKLIENNGPIDDIFYVGDAAGRTHDFNDTDRKFAANCNIRFYTPNEYFDNVAPEPFIWFTEDPKLILSKYKVAQNIEFKKYQEIVILVGPPASGKSTLSKLFVDNGYIQISNDLYKTKCLKLAKDAIKDGKSVIIDNTNPSKKERAKYLSFGVPARCIIMDVELNHCKHFNFHRSKIVPAIAYNRYKSVYVEPSKDEGFIEIEKYKPYIPDSFLLLQWSDY